MDSKRIVTELLAGAGIVVNGTHPWDPQIHDERVYDRFITSGTIAIGDSYVDGWWDVDDLSEMVARVLRSGTAASLFRMPLRQTAPLFLKSRIGNLQNAARAFQVGEKHYDIGNDLYERMLDPTMTYTCGYWKDADTLAEAQEAKLDLICRKIGLKKGDRVLDIGCGWGSFLIYAAERYGAHGVGLTISREQAAVARERAKGLPIEIRVQDYRAVSDGPYDHIVSIGMFEHVGHKNYRTYMETARRLLKEDGLFLLHTIGTSRTHWRAEPWLEKNIFPNGYIPSAKQITTAIDGWWLQNAVFIVEDWHNFGNDYDRTLTEWFKNFDAAWPELRGKYDERFYRMWKFYLLSCAGGFRSRWEHLWQIVLSPKGVAGGYTSVR